MIIEWAVVSFEDPEPMLRRPIAEHEVPWLCYNGRRLSAEHLGDPRPRAP
jgi:hypothetical protein